MRINLRYLGITLFLGISALVAANPVELVSGDLKLVLYPDSGSFSLYEMPASGQNRYVPLFEDRNAAVTSSFAVNAGGRVFKLARRLGRPVTFERKDESAVITFQITDDIRIIQRFSFERRAAIDKPFGIRIETELQNLSDRSMEMALRLILDTNLGESEGIHFFTDKRRRISSETLIGEGDGDTLIVSRNNLASLMLLFGRGGLSRPAAIYLANWDRLNTLTWVPDFSEGRTFNSRYTVNDSALMCIWPYVQVPSKNSTLVTTVLGRYEADYYGSEVRDVPVVTEPVIITPVVPAPAVTEPVAVSVIPETVGNETSNYEQDLALINQLLARIEEIERNPEIATAEELEKLNQSLDVMLERLKDYQ